MATTTARRRPSNEQIAERQAKVEALTEQLHAAVLDLTSSDAWIRMLNVASKFHTYSWRNQVLLAIQAEDRGIALTRVAGFNRWKELGRIVRWGEKGLAILAPVKRRLSAEKAAKQAAQGLPTYDGNGRPLMVVRGFRIEHVFDQSQTDALPGAEKLPEPRSWISQRGEGPAGLWDAICELIEGEGFSLEHRPPAPEDAGAHGWSNGRTKVVWIRSDVDEAERIRVAIHELAHIRADHFGRDVTRSQGECEADSIAYVVAKWAGIDISSSSIEYLAGWSDGTTEVLEAALTAIHNVAASIIADLEIEGDES